MTPDQMIEVIRAFGVYHVEYRHKGLTTWQTLTAPVFDFTSLDYRVNGYEYKDTPDTRTPAPSDDSPATTEDRLTRFPTQPRPEPNLSYTGVTYHHGQKFRKGGDGEIYMLCQAAPYMVGFIGLQSGNRWTEFVAVNKPEAVTQIELDRISGSCPGEFVPVDDTPEITGIQTAIGVESPADPTEVFKIGDKFMLDEVGPYMLARVGPNDVILSNMASGNRWGDVERVRQPYHLYREDLVAIAGTTSIRPASSEEIHEGMGVVAPTPTTGLPIGTTTPADPGTWYPIGSRAMICSGGPYILAQVGERSVCFVDIVNGNRWTEPVLVRNPHKLYMEDLKAIAAEDDVVVIVNE